MKETDFRFPKITEKMSNEEKFKAITEYLWQFQQAVIHELTHLSPENFTEKTLKEMSEAIGGKE